MKEKTFTTNEKIALALGWTYNNEGYKTTAGGRTYYAHAWDYPEEWAHLVHVMPIFRVPDFERILKWATLSNPRYWEDGREVLSDAEANED